MVTSYEICLQPGLVHKIGLRGRTHEYTAPHGLPQFCDRANWPEAPGDDTRFCGLKKGLCQHARISGACQPIYHNMCRDTNCRAQQCVPWLFSYSSRDRQVEIWIQLRPSSSVASRKAFRHSQNCTTSFKSHDPRTANTDDSVTAVAKVRPRRILDGQVFCDGMIQDLQKSASKTTFASQSSEANLLPNRSVKTAFTAPSRRNLRGNSHTLLVTRYSIRHGCIPAGLSQQHWC